MLYIIRFVCLVVVYRLFCFRICLCLVCVNVWDYFALLLLCVLFAYLLCFVGLLLDVCGCCCCLLIC